MSTNAGTALLSAPIEVGEGDVAGVSAWTMGYLSEHQVRLYMPLLWHVAIALAVLLEGSWGHLAEEIGATGRASRACAMARRSILPQCETSCVNSKGDKRPSHDPQFLEGPKGEGYRTDAR